jgi:hypothetical protein
MTGNINANGGIDVDDAFVVADGGALTTSQSATFNSTTTFNGLSTFNTDVDVTLTGTENVSLTSDLAGTVNLISIVGTPSSTAGTTRGISIQQANHASNTNGLDTGILIDNADADLALTTGIQFTNSGGGGFTNFIDTPSIDITGSGAITGATSYNGLVITANTGTITTGTWNAATIAVAYGGTGATTLTQNGVLYGNGTSAIAATTAGTNGQLLLGVTSSAPAFATMSGDATITNTGVLTIAADAVALGSDTTGNYIATIASGNGITISGSGSESAAATVALGSLTANWSQTGAFDIVLNNASSELSIRSADGAAFFGTLDVATLTSDKTYILPSFTGSSADICLSTGNCSGGGSAVNGSGTGGYVTFWQDNDTITGENMFVYDSTNHVLSLGLGGAAADTSALLDIYGENKYMVLRPADVTTDGDTNNSAILRFRGTYDSDVAIGPVTSSNFNFDIRNIMTAAGASPASRLAFINNSSSEVFSVTSNGAATLNAPNAETTALTITDTDYTNALSIGDNNIVGTTAAIDFTNFDVATSGNITVAAGVGLDTNAAGTLALGGTSATTVSIGTTAATTLNLAAGGALTRVINIGTGTGADTINIGTGGTTADTITIGNNASSTSISLISGTSGINASSTATSGTAFSLSDTALTSGSIFSFSGTSTPTGGGTINIGSISLTDAASTSAPTTTGVNLSFSNQGAIAHNQYAMSIVNAAVGSFTDTATEALLLLDQADTTTTGTTALTNALLITNSGGSTLTNGITIGSGSQAIATALNISSTGVTTDISLQNGESINNDTDGVLALVSNGANGAGVLRIPIKSSTGESGLDTTGGNIYYNSTDGKFRCYENGSWKDCIGSGGTPGGSNTQMQYNNGGVFGGTSSFTFNNSTLELTITDNLTLTLAEDEDLAIGWSVSGTQPGQAQAITITNSSTSANQYGINITNTDSTGVTEAAINIDNADTTTASLTDGILITSSGINNGITNALDVSAANILNGINLGANFALFDGIRIFEGTTGTLTFEDTSGNDLATLVDQGTTGDLTLTGNLAVNGGSITTTAATATIFNTNATTLSLGGAATTALNIGTGNSAYTAINIGTGTGGNTINIGTNDTTADTINLGSTKDTLAIKGTNITTTLLTTNSAIFSSSTVNTDSIAIKPQTATATNSFTGTITSSDLTADRTWTLPDADGTVTFGTGTAARVAYWSATNTLTSSGNFVFNNATTSGNSLFLQDTSLTTGRLTDFVGTSTPTTNTAITQNLFDITYAQSTSANTNGFTGLAVNFTNNPSVAGNTEYAARIQNQVTSNTTDNAVAALLLLDNADTSATGSTIVTDALRITNSGGISAGITNGITFGSTTIDTGLNFSSTPSSNYISGTNWSVTAAGAETLADDLAVNGGDITTTSSTFNLANSATTLNLGSTNVTRNINIGTGTNADTINIGTGGVNADTINIGNNASTTALNFTSGTGAQTFTSSSASGTGASSAFAFIDNALTSGTEMYISSTSISTGKLLQLSNAANSLTSGTLLDVSSTSTAVTGSSTGLLGYFNWNPGSTTTATGDLFRINIGSNGNIENIFNITDNGTSLFAVGETSITSALPHSFTAAGDTVMAYDLVFTNQTSSYIKSNAPLYLQAGESFENNPLSLQTYGTGNVVIDPQGTGYFEVNSTSTNITGTTATNLNVAGEYIHSADADTITTLIRNNNSSITMANVGTAGAQGDPGVLTIEANGGTTTNYNLITAYNSTTRSDAAAVFRVRADGNVYGEAAFNSSGADVAEYFEKEGDIEPGDIIGINPITGKARKYQSGDTLLGAFSTKPGFVGNRPESMTDEDIAANYALTGLVGQIKVKVTTTNGTIFPGDAIAPTNTPGIGAKANTSGIILGTAIEGYANTNSSEVGMITVYVNRSWYNATPSSPLEANADLTNLQNQLQILSSYFSQNQDGLKSLGIDKATFKQLVVLNDTTLGDTVINGKLNVGTMQFDNLTNSIDAIGVLKIQPLALGNVEFLGGLITFDTKGNITAKEVTAEKYSVAGTSAGTDIIPAGTRTVTISTSLVNDNSLIFITPKVATSYPLAVTQKQTGKYFVVEMAVSASQDVAFDWWIVDHK